jgi:hypothetical protein
LLHSVLTFRFFESAFTRFIRTLVIDFPVPPSFQDGRLPTYCEYLVSSITDSIPLLPQGLLDLFSDISRRRWTPEQLFRLFFRRFLWRSAILWVSHFCGPVHTPTLRVVIQAISQSSGSVSVIYTKFFTSRSILNAPGIYRCFGHQSLEFRVSVRDVHLAGQALHRVRRLPETVTLAELQRVPDGCDSCVYDVQIYPRRDVRAPVALFPIVPLFGVSADGVEVLERLFTTRLHEAAVADWLATIAGLQDIKVSPLLSDVFARPVDDFLDAFRNYALAFGIAKLNRRIYLALLETQLPRWLSAEQQSGLAALGAPAPLLADLFRGVELPVVRNRPGRAAVRAAAARVALRGAAEAAPGAALARLAPAGERAAAAIGERLAVECGLSLAPNACPAGVAAAVAAAAAEEAAAGPVGAAPDVRALARFEVPPDASPPLDVIADRLLADAVWQAVLTVLGVQRGAEAVDCDVFTGGSGLGSVGPPRIGAVAGFRSRRRDRG